MAGVNLDNLSDQQLDLLEKYHKQGMDSLSEEELSGLQDIINPSMKKQAIGALLGGAKAIGAGLVRLPGAIGDTLNQTTQVGKEPDIQKEGITSQKELAEKFANMPKGDEGFAGGIDKTLGWEPQNKFEDYLSAGTTGAAATLASPGTALPKLAKAVYQGVVPQVAGKFASETAAGAGASTNTQKQVGFLTSLFSPYLGARARTPLPVSDMNRRVSTKTLNEAGINTSAGQDTGRKWLLNKEGNAFAGRNEQQAKEFTKAVTTELGQPTDAATIGVGQYMPTVGKNIKNNMDAVSSRNNINLGVMAPHEQLDLRSSLEKLARDNPHHVDPILSEIHRHTGWTPNMIGAPTVANPRQAAAERIWRTLFPGARVIPGEDYQRLRSQMFSSASDLAKSDPTLAESFRNTARTLDQGMRYSIARQNPTDSGAFENARQLLENHMIVNRARSKATGSNRDQINPNKLESAGRRVIGDNRWNAGDTPFQPLSSAAQNAMPPLKEGSKDWHNTTLAGAATGAVGGIVAPLLAMKHGSGLNAATEAGIYGLLQGSAMGAIPAWLGQKLATTRPGQAYLRNQVLPAIPQNAAARRRNAVLQALIATQGNQPTQPAPNQDNQPHVPLSR